MRIFRGSVTVAGLLAAALAVGASDVNAQKVSVGPPTTLIVGTPAAGARVERVDTARSGRTRTDLPTSRLRTEWRIPLGTLVEQPPLVDSRGTIYLLGARGDVFAIARDGSQRWRASTNSASPGPAALLSDDSLVFVDGGQAVAVRDGALRWRAHVGHADPLHAAPLPLEDGGVVIASGRELVALDAEGQERARTTLPEASGAPLVSALGKTLAVTASGAVWSWVPGAAEPSRVATFGSAIDGGAALSDDHTLWAVTDGQAHLTSVDLLRKTSATRAVAGAGLWLGPPTVLGGAVCVVSLSATNETAVTFDASRSEGTNEGTSEVARTILAVRAPSAAAPDAGPGTRPAVPHTAPIVDPRGALAFATVDGAIGVATTSERDMLAEGCEPPLGSAARSAPPVVGLAPLEPGAFVAACHSGALLAISGAVSPRRAPASSPEPGGKR